MKIAAATVAMQSQHTAVQRQEAQQSLRMWVGVRQANGQEHHHHHDAVQISDSGRAKQSSDAQATGDSGDALDNDPKLSLIRQMIELLTGKRIRTIDTKDLQGGNTSADVPDSGRNQTAPADTANHSAGYGVAYDYHSVNEEAEATNFSAQGVVKTADGKEIAFTLSLDMSRYYREEVNVSFRAGDAAKTDPLVINFNGNAAQLTDQRFSFDLNADGNAEQVAMLASGSGYLALDKNGNGTIDSGKELFGPNTGSGFGELAAYDQDGNGWIDENDAAYSRLRIWTPSVDGSGTLTTLKQQSVGALFLGQTATPFALRGSQNSDLGAVAATGLYLTEDGRAGSVQEIDLSA